MAIITATFFPGAKSNFTTFPGGWTGVPGARFKTTRSIS